MKETKISIGNRTYNVQLAETEEDQEKGLGGLSELHEDNGMLFLFEETNPVGFTMKDTLIPLDIIFLDEEFVVTQIFNGIPGSDEILDGDANYVLEVNSGSGVNVGDELEFKPTDNKEKSQKMLVLNSSGDVQMEISGGERIFSRDHTKTLIKFAKKAVTTDNDNDYKALGKRAFKFLKTQEETPAEYVQSKN